MIFFFFKESQEIEWFIKVLTRATARDANNSFEQNG